VRNRQSQKTLSAPLLRRNALIGLFTLSLQERILGEREIVAQLLGYDWLRECGQGLHQPAD
jgi:hypothetical protein